MKRLRPGTIAALMVMAILVVVPVIFGRWFAGVGALVVGAVAYYAYWRRDSTRRLGAFVVFCSLCAAAMLFLAVGTISYGLSTEPDGPRSVFLLIGLFWLAVMVFFLHVIWTTVQRKPRNASRD